MLTIAWLNIIESKDSDSINIGFRSFGDYSLKGASLVSGVQHITNNDFTFSSKMSAQLTSQYQDKHYNGTVSGIAGLNYKSGDDFSFDIHLIEAIKENGTLEITITDLYKNIWAKN